MSYLYKLIKLDKWLTEFAHILNGVAVPRLPPEGLDILGGCLLAQSAAWIFKGTAHQHAQVDTFNWHIIMDQG